jgi:hypothetical protein
MKETIFIFEYQPPRTDGGECCLHYNTSFRNGVFNQPLFSNGYYPIAVLPDSIRKHSKWPEFLSWVIDTTPTPEALTFALYTWIFTNAPEWTATIR